MIGPHYLACNALVMSQGRHRTRRALLSASSLWPTGPLAGRINDISRTTGGANSQNLEEFFQTPESRFGINRVRLRSPASMRNPVAILSHLIDLLDAAGVAPFEDLQYLVEAAVFGFLPTD
jgi:hypothetical protein